MISKEDYFFYEWLIIGKGYTEEKFRQIKPSEWEALKAEYDEFKSKLITLTHEEAKRLGVG